MTPETIQAIKEALEPLLNKAGTSIDTLYQLCAKQSQVLILRDWVTIGVFLLLAGIFAVFITIVVVHDKRNKSYDRWHDEGWCITILCVGGLSVAVLLFVAIACGIDLVTRYMNPELQIWLDTINVLQTLIPG